MLAEIHPGDEGWHNTPTYKAYGDLTVHYTLSWSPVPHPIVMHLIPFIAWCDGPDRTPTGNQGVNEAARPHTGSERATQGLETTQSAGLLRPQLLSGVEKGVKKRRLNPV